VFAQAGLAGALVTAGFGHLSFQRREFQAQVPSWFPADPDTVVVVSGYVELAIAAALAITWRQPVRRRLGTAVAAFFVGVFPGNIAQYTEHNDGLGLNTNRTRALRLLGQPVLIAWALAATRSGS
jgi:uncharacterized membrane protein